MGKPKKILIVEDNEDCRFILVRRLRKIDQFDIREAADGQHAIDAVRAELPDLIFIDLGLPGVNGWEATRRIRQLPGGDRVPIIAYTARAMQWALDADCDDYIAKPVMNLCVVLREKLERWLPAAEEAR